ncbi:MAG: aminomethyl transferase family protein [Planctomycetota bacterium]|nr:MAG: aminomethyl transferase family protein [Planctomycetota bacterium]
MDRTSRTTTGRDALREMQQQAGAVFPEGDDASLGPLHFDDPAGEYKAAVERCAVLELPGRARIELTGGDRASFLHNFCTNDINRLAAGEGCEAFVTSVKGRILGHIFVGADTDSLWIDSGPGSDEFLLAHLDKYLITEDVELHNRTGQFGSLLVCGPDAAKCVDNALGIDAGGLAMCHHASGVLDERTVTATRVPFTTQPSYLLTVESELLARLWEMVAATDAQPTGSAVFDVLRIEAGMPVYGRDISEEQIAQEAGRNEAAISFTKGCYLGQEPIARLDALGHVNRELRGLRIESESAPEIGAKVFGETGEKEVGSITSSAACPGEERSVALALRRRECTQPGTLVTIGGAEGERVTAEVFWE